MKVTTFKQLLAAANTCTSLDIFYIEYAKSLPKEYYVERGNIQKTIDLLQAIWELRKVFTFRNLLKVSKLSMSEFSERYNIPLDIIEKWVSGDSDPQQYVLDLLAADVVSIEDYET